MKEAQRKIVEAGNITGVGALSPDKICELVEKGEKILMVGTDINALRNVFLNLGQAIKF